MLHRNERAESFIQQELTLILREQTNDPRLAGLTVTGVDITKDRRIARVYVASYAAEEELEAGFEGLESAKGFLRRELAQRLHWPFTPYLEFRPDRSWQHGEHMDRLFEQIENERDGEESSETTDTE